MSIYQPQIDELEKKRKRAARPADDWTTELDRLRAKSAAAKAKQSSIYQPQIDEKKRQQANRSADILAAERQGLQTGSTAAIAPRKPATAPLPLQAEAAPVKPPTRPFAFFEDDSAWGRMDAERAAQSTSDVLRDREVAQRIGREAFVRNLLTSTAESKLDTSPLVIVSSGGNDKPLSTQLVRPDGTRLVTAPLERPKPPKVETEPGVPLYELPLGEMSSTGIADALVGEIPVLNLRENMSDFLRYIDENSKALDENPLVQMQGQPLNWFERAIYSLFPPGTPYVNLALLQRYPMSSKVNPAINQNLPQIKGNALDLFSHSGLSNLIINNWNNPDIIRIGDEMMTNLQRVGPAVEQKADAFTNTENYRQIRNMLVSEMLQSPSYMLMYQTYRDAGLEHGEASALARNRAEKEIEARLQQISTSVSLYESGSGIVGVLFGNIGLAYNSFYGGIEGGEFFREAAFHTLTAMNALTVIDDAILRTETPDGRTVLEDVALVRDGVASVFGPLPKSAQTEDMIGDAIGWISAASALTANRWAEAWDNTSERINAANKDVIDAKWDLAIQNLEEQRSQLESELIEARKGADAFKVEALEKRLEIYETQINVLKDAKYTGIAMTIDDLELRLDTVSKRIEAVEGVQENVKKAYELYAKALNMPAMTLEQKLARDAVFMEASELMSSASEVLYENPSALFERGYTPERFYLDIFAPSIAFDGLPVIARWAGVLKSSFVARVERAADISGTAKIIESAGVAAEGVRLAAEGRKAGEAAMIATRNSEIATRAYAKMVADATGLPLSSLAGKSVKQLDELMRTAKNFPALGKTLDDIKQAYRAAAQAEEKADAALRRFAQLRKEYEGVLDAVADRMQSEIAEAAKRAQKISEKASKGKVGRQSSLSTIYRRSSSAASAVAHDTIPALTDALMYATTKEDVVVILRALKDPKKFFDGVEARWTSPTLMKASNNGVDKVIFNSEPWKSKNAVRGLQLLSKRIDEFIESADYLIGTGPVNKDLLMIQLNDFIRATFARETWAGTAKAQLPFGTKSARVGKGSVTGAPKVQYVNEAGHVIREVPAPDLRSAHRLVDEINSQVKGDYYRKGPVAFIGDLKRTILAIPFIGYNPANLIQQFMHPIVNSLLGVDGGVSVFNRRRLGLRSVQDIEEHMAKLYGTANTTMRDTASDFASVIGAGKTKNRTLAEKIARPLGPVYVSVEEGMGKRFKYDATIKYLQKYGRTVVKQVLIPSLIERGVDIQVANKAGNVFFDVAYREGFEAGARAAMDVINGNVTRYTMSDFDPHWASWMHPSVAMEIEAILNSSLTIADVDARIADIINKFDAQMADFAALTTAQPNGTRHAFTVADSYQDRAALKNDLIRAANNASPKARPEIKSEYKDVLAAMKQYEKMLAGLVNDVARSTNPDVGKVFYHIWKLMRDGRTNITMKANELAELVHLAGGKERWATEYWPQVRDLWTEYYKNMIDAMAESKAALDSGDLSRLGGADDLIVEHSRHTDDFLKNQLKIEPGSGKYDESLKLVMQAAQAIERNQHSVYASVSVRSGASPARIFDEAISAERDIAMQKITIRGQLDRLLEQTIAEFEKTGDAKVWSEYYTQRNALWRSLFSEYVPTRWQEATRNLFEGRRDVQSLLNEIITVVGNITPERAAEIANTVRATLAANTLPPARVVSPSKRMNSAVRKFVDKKAIFDEIFPLIDGGGAEAIRTASNRVVKIDTLNIDPIDKRIVGGDGRLRDLSTIRQIEDANGNVLWDVDSSPAWEAAQLVAEQDAVAKQAAAVAKGAQPAQGAVSGATPPVNPALAGIVNKAFGDEAAGIVGWMDTLAMLQPRAVRNVLIDALERLKALHPGIDETKAFLEAMNDVYDIDAVIRGQGAVGIERLDAVWESPLATDSVASTMRRWATLFDEPVQADFERALEDSFRSIYGDEPSSAIAALSSPGIVAEPRVNRANAAEKIAKVFGVPDEMAEGLSQLIESYARRNAETWIEQDGILDPRFTTREEYLEHLIDRWYDDALVDIVRSGRETPVASGTTTVAQVETIQPGTPSSRSIVRVMDSIENVPDEAQRLRIGLHEMFHVFHEDLVRQSSRGNTRATEMLIALHEYVSDEVYRPGQLLEWKPSYMERLSVVGEEWIATGRARVSALQPVLDQFRKWFAATIATYEEFKRWLSNTPLSAGSNRTKQYVNNVAYRIFDEMFGGKRARIPTLSEQGVAIVSGALPNVGKAKTEPDIKYMNIIRSAARDVFPELAEALKDIKNLKDVPPQLMPLVQQMADIAAMRHNLRQATKVGDAAKATKLQAELDAAAKIHQAYSPEFREAIRDGIAVANKHVNTRAPAPNAAALYSIEQLRALRDKVVAELRNRSIEIAKRDRAGLRPRNRPALPSSPGADVPAMPPSVGLDVSGYVYSTFRNQWDKVMNGANLAGDAMRSFTMVDFWNRTRLDDILQLFMPFPFWSTRDIKNGMERMLRNPGFVYHMYRTDQAFDRGFAAWDRENRDEEKKITPGRYANKWGFAGGGIELPEWASEVFVPIGKNNELVPVAAFFPASLSRFFPTVPMRVKEAVDANRNVNTGNSVIDLMGGASYFGLSFDPWISSYLAQQSGQITRTSVVDWSNQSRLAVWGILRSMHPEQWGNAPTALRPAWFEYSVAREVENMAARGLIDRMTLGLAMDYLYRLYNKQKFDSPEWQMATQQQKDAVWNTLIAARDAASAKVLVQTGTGLATGFPVYVYDSTEGRTNWLAKVRSRLYYDPTLNPLGSNEAANLMSRRELALLARDAKNKIVPKSDGTPKLPSPIVMAASSQRNEDMLALEAQTTRITQQAVYELLKEKPKATKEQMNAAKVDALLPTARKILGDKVVDEWLANEKKNAKGKEKLVTNYVGLIELMRSEVAKATPSAYTEKSNTTVAPEGTPRRYMQDHLAHGSVWPQTGADVTPQQLQAYADALGRFPSPENPDILRQNHQLEAIKLVIDIHKYPEYGKVTPRQYAQAAEKVDKAREEHLAKLLRISVEDARKLLEQYRNRYLGEAEIKRREEIDKEKKSYSRSSRSRRYGRRYSRRSYRSSGYGGYGGGWGGYRRGGSGGEETMETDLLPSIESYFRQRNRLSGFLWTMPRSRYAVR